MSILDYFRPKKKKTASIAKERLQIIIAHQGNKDSGCGIDYLPQLQEDILKVISKYVEIDPDDIKVQLDTNDEDCPILELNVALPDKKILIKKQL